MFFYDTIYQNKSAEKRIHKCYSLKSNSNTASLHKDIEVGVQEFPGALQNISYQLNSSTQPAVTCSELTIEALEKIVNAPSYMLDWVVKYTSGQLLLTSIPAGYIRELQLTRGVVTTQSSM